MKRPLFVTGFSLSAAMWTAFLFRSNLSLYISLAFLAASFAMFLIKGKSYVKITAVLMSFSLAFAIYSHHIFKNMAPFLNITGLRSLSARGIVVDIKYSGRAIDYVIKTQFLDESLPPATVSARDYGEKQASVGDSIAFNYDISEVDHFKNGIFLKGSISNVKFYKKPLFPLDYALIKARSYIRNNIYSSVSYRNAPLICKMIFGLNEEIDPGISGNMNRSGIIHLLSVSGMHFSVIVQLVRGLISKITERKRIISGITMLFCIAFAGVTGFSPSIIRALVMMLVISAAQMFIRRSDSVNNLGLAFIIICIFRPEWTAGMSFWLSGMATLGIILYAKKLDTAIKKGLKLKGIAGVLAGEISAGIALSISAYIFTFPLLTLKYGYFSVMSPITSLITGPLIPPMMISAVLCGLFTSGSIIIKAAAWVTDIMADIINCVSRFFAGFKYAVFALDNIFIFIWIILAVLIIVLMLALGFNKRLKIYAVCTVIILFSAANIMNTSFRARHIELVHIENASMIIKGKEAIVLGCPNRYNTYRIKEYLSFRGIESVPVIIAPDAKNQISSGIISIAESYGTKGIIAPSDDYIMRQMAKAIKDADVYSCKDAVIKIPEEISIEFITPARAVVNIAGIKALKCFDEDIPAGYDIIIDSMGEIVTTNRIIRHNNPISKYALGEELILIKV